jgi:AcrR family transcriptional regulator
VGKHRATAVDEKAARRLRMLEAAAELLASWSYVDITMARLAASAGVAKGTLYLYFRTKEELFLELYELRLGSWYDDLETLALAGTETIEPAVAARVISSTIATRPILVRLHGILHCALGFHVDAETTAAFRRRQSLKIAPLAAALAGRISGLTDDRAFRFLIRLEAVVGGLSSTAIPPTSRTRSFADAEPVALDIDFETELREIVTALLR